MAIDVICDACNKSYRVKEELAGRCIKCTDCGGVISIPVADVVEEAWDDDLEEDRSQSQRSLKGANKVSQKSMMEEVFGDGTILLKMVGGALVTPVLLVAVMAKGNRKAGKPLDFTDPMMIAALIGSIPVGAVLGAMLTVKDVVQGRVQRGARVPFPLVLMFGKGIVSALLWIPFVFFVVLVITIATV